MGGTLRAPSSWPVFAEEVEATFLEGSGSRNPTILGEVDGWDFAIIGSAARGFRQTLATVPYASRDDFTFRLRPVTVLGRLLRRLTAPPAWTEDETFNRAFAVRTNDRTRLRELLVSAEIRKLVRQRAEGGSMHLEARRELFMEERHEIRFWVERIVEDLEELRGILALLVETLRQMRRMGSIEGEG